MTILNASEVTRQAAAIRDADKWETRLIFFFGVTAGAALVLMLIGVAA